MRLKEVLIAFKTLGREIAQWNSAVNDTRLLAEEREKNELDSDSVWRDNMLMVRMVHLRRLSITLEDQIARLFFVISDAEPGMDAQLTSLGQVLRD